MNRPRWMSLYSLILIFALSTACLTLFPQSPEATSAEEWDEPERGPLKFDPPSLPNAKVNVPYEVQIEVTQNVTPVGDFIVEPKALPPGLELSMVENEHDLARLTGVPEKAGTYTFSIFIWCYGTNVSGQTGSKEYRIVVE